MNITDEQIKKHQTKVEKIANALSRNSACNYDELFSTGLVTVFHVLRYDENASDAAIQTALQRRMWECVTENKELRDARGIRRREQQARDDAKVLAASSLDRDEKATVLTSCVDPKSTDAVDELETLNDLRECCDQMGDPRIYKIVEMKRARHSTQAIARYLGCSMSSVKRLLAELLDTYRGATK